MHLRLLFLLTLIFFVHFSFCLDHPPQITPHSPAITETLSSSGFNLILYIQPGGNTRLTNGSFCTVKESPCSSIQQAIDQVLEMYYDRKIIDQPSARFILMPNLSADDPSKRLIYGKDQCNSSFNRWFYYLLLESMSREEVIEFNCEGDSLVLPDMFFGLYMMRINLLDALLRIDERMVVLYMYEVHATKSRVGYTRKGSEVVVQFSLLYSSFKDEDIQLYATNININGSKIERVRFYLSSQVNMSISHSDLSQLKVIAYQQEESTSQDVFISFSKLNNTEWDISNFQNVYIEQIDIFNDFQISIFYTYTISIGKMHTRGNNVRFFAKFVGISGGIDIEKSYFDSVSNIGNSKHIFEITTTPFLHIGSSIFSNNKSPLFSVAICGEMRLYQLQFIGNRGPCIYSDLDNGLGLRSTVVFHSKFINNSCSDCYGGALFLRGAGFVGLESTFVGNTAINGGACYLSAESIGLTNSKFIENRATLKGGAFYVEYVDSGSVDGAFNFECIDNFAQYSGGCYYSTNRTLVFELKDPILKGNHANSYGESFGYPFFDLNYLTTVTYYNGTISKGETNSFPELSLYAGQIITSIEITLWNNGTKRVSYLESPIEIEVNSSLVLLNYEQQKYPLTSTIRIENLYFTQKYVNPSFFDLHMKIENYNLSPRVRVLNCPPGLSLVQSVAQIGTLTCIENPTIPYQIIIPVVAVVTLLIVGIVAFCIFFIMRMTIVIVRKLQLLNRKLEAEKKMESKLLEKRVALIDEYEEVNEKSSLLINSNGKISTNSSNRSIVDYSSSWNISIDDIEILKKIAEGASGCIYLCDWKGTKVALKTLKEQMEVDNDILFEQEAAMLSTLRHPNIVQFFGVVFCSRKYIAVEYLEKGSLDKLIYNSKAGIAKLSFTKKLEILYGTAKGMAYLHTMKPKPIIHRDLKPGNILIDNDLTPKICDFGLSKVWNNTFSNQSPTMNVGTFFYMANEMISGAQYNHKVDIYSFGIIMWELFFEDSPYINQNSPKLCKYGKGKEDDVSHLGFNALGKVLSGERPIIPFHEESSIKLWVSEFLLEQLVDENILESTTHAVAQYIDLMKNCWNGTPSERPEFTEITITLSNLLEQVSRLKI